MRPTLSVALVSLSLIVCFGCAGGGPRQARTPADENAAAGAAAHRQTRSGSESQAEEEREAAPEVDPELARAAEQALDRVLSASGDWRELHVVTECAGDAGFRRVELFGDGVGIWQGRRQFSLDHDQLVAVLRLFHRAGFPAMPEMFGSEGEEEIPVPQEPGQPVVRGLGQVSDRVSDQAPAAILRVTCRVLLTLDGVTKQSNQLSEGPQSAELRDLAEGILDLCREPGEGGFRALNMTDGLRKVADGRLAPETLSLLLHHKPEAAAIERGEPAFLMRLRGARVTVRPFLGTQGYGDPVGLDLDRAQVAHIANLLADNGLGSLPANLYADHYTDLTVDLLDQHAEIQARQFARMTRGSHGESQLSFDRIYTGLAALARQVLEKVPVPPKVNVHSR